jgi:uncharacterized protein
MNKTQIISTTQVFVKQRLEGESTGHDWWHVERTRNIARTIHAVEGGNWLIIELTLLLHDVGDRKVINQENDDYSIAEDFLVNQKVPLELISQIMTIIKTMSYSKSFDTQSTEKSIEFEIVQDADRLDALGAIGIARAFTFGGNCGRPLYDPTYETKTFQSTSEYKKIQGSTYHHFEEKLLLLKDLLNTQTAKKIASRRDAFIRHFLSEFLEEWKGVT